VAAGAGADPLAPVVETVEGVEQLVAPLAHRDALGALALAQLVGPAGPVLDVGGHQVVEGLAQQSGERRRPARGGEGDGDALAGSSTALTNSARASAASRTAWFTSGVAAAVTNQAPSRSEGVKSRSTTVTRVRSMAAETCGAITVTSAPAASSAGIFAAAVAPPPTTTTRRPSKRTNTGSRASSGVAVSLAAAVAGRWRPNQAPATSATIAPPRSQPVLTGTGSIPSSSGPGTPCHGPLRETSCHMMPITTRAANADHHGAPGARSSGGTSSSHWASGSRNGCTDAGSAMVRSPVDRKEKGPES
jgi:hypothetical protein